MLTLECAQVSSRDSKQRFVRAVESAHGPRLRRFLASRLREGMADLPDMVQEVYLRLLRVESPESIENPEAYVLTIAKHVLYEHRTRRVPTAGAADIGQFEHQLATEPADDPEVRAVSAERLAILRQALSGLSPKARAVLVLHRVEGLTLEEIGRRLGVSRSMAKKYLAKALARCRATGGGE